MKRLLLVVGPVGMIMATFAACDGQTLDLGTGGPGSDSGLSSASSGTDASPAEGSGDDDDETWTGYIEDYQFISGSDALSLTFTRQSDGGVTGHAVFGNLPLYPPATDPNIGYPSASLDGGLIAADSFEGFRYTILNGRVDGSRIRAKVDTSEVDARWCALQTSYPYGQEEDGGPSGNYNCLPTAAAGGNPPPGSALPAGCYLFFQDGGAVPEECGKLYACGYAPRPSTCTCSATSCTNNAGQGDQPAFDFQIDGSQAQGSVDLVGDQSSANTLHLTRQ